MNCLEEIQNQETKAAAKRRTPKSTKHQTSIWTAALCRRFCFSLSNRGTRFFGQLHGAQSLSRAGCRYFSV